jgi:C1A family cysteine protease
MVNTYAEIKNSIIDEVTSAQIQTMHDMQYTIDKLTKENSDLIIRIELQEKEFNERNSGLVKENVRLMYECQNLSKSLRSAKTTLIRKQGYIVRMLDKMGILSARKIEEREDK